MSRINYREALPSQEHAKDLLEQYLAEGKIIEAERPVIEEYDGNLPDDEDGEHLKLWRITILGS